jgi:hypothetical protein
MTAFNRLNKLSSPLTTQRHGASQHIYCSIRVSILAQECNVSYFHSFGNRTHNPLAAKATPLPLDH